MNALTEAITKQYQRQQELITERDRNLASLSSISSEIKDGFLYSCLLGEIHRFYRIELGEIQHTINTLER